MQTCDNTDGSYHCSCWDGYELNSDGYSCYGKLISYLTPLLLLAIELFALVIEQEYILCSKTNY